MTENGHRPRFSLIVPVYNRRNEIAELTESLKNQTFKDFEAVIVEDGSTETCEDICKAAQNHSAVKYYYKDNEGRSIARNYGMDRADGDFFVFVDSDCILPPDYFQNLDKALRENPTDCFGGPDAAHDSFSDKQKAINFAMTSFLTTGGIRGGKVSMEKFTPRTFNMGFSKDVYKKTGGFREMYSEDIDMSTRIRQNRFSTSLYSDVKVFHKRRVNFKKFWKQVHLFGRSRITLKLLYPGSMKAVHWLPALFTVGTALLAIASFVISPWVMAPLALYFGAIGTSASIKSHNIKIGMLAIPASFIQLAGYGSGFIRAYVWKILLGHGRDINQEINDRKGK